jgi:hypothetical protein
MELQERCSYAVSTGVRIDGPERFRGRPVIPTWSAVETLVDGVSAPYVACMRTLAMCFWMSSWVLSSAACHDDEDEDEATTEVSARSQVAAARVDQIKPPLDLQTPPADAEKTASGLVYKTLVSNRAGAQAKANETVLIQYTGWIKRTGVTFFTTRGRGQPIAIDLAHSAPGFAEALPLLHKGEKAVMWLPPSADTAEAVVYELEVVDIVRPPAVTAQATPDAALAPGPEKR